MARKNPSATFIDLICCRKGRTPTETQDDQSVQARFQALAASWMGLQSRGLAMNHCRAKPATESTKPSQQRRRTEISNHTAAQHTTAERRRVAAVQLFRT